ncbi:MAG: hypothetical protein ACRDRZ_14680 [Pseudonocardiaceae bacterium]
MPIRTHRGRAAVYRKLWGWPVRSPLHLVATLVVVAGLGAGIAFALPEDPGTPRAVGTSSADRPNPFDRASRAAVPGARDEAPAPALAVADSWVRAFVTTPPGITSEQWVEQLRPYTTDQVLTELQSVDPANVPEAQVTGPPRTVSFSGGSAEVDVPTSAVVVRLLVVRTPGGWRVAGYEQAG